MAKVISSKSAKRDLKVYAQAASLAEMRGVEAPVKTLEELAAKHEPTEVIAAKGGRVNVRAQRESLAEMRGTQR